MNYDDFWENIIKNPDGSLNEEQILKELNDYSMVLNSLSSAYDLMTGGMISKPGTSMDVVEDIFHQNFLYVGDDSGIIWGDAEDLNGIMDDAETLGELKAEIKEYFKL